MILLEAYNMKNMCIIPQTETDSPAVDRWWYDLSYDKKEGMNWNDIVRSVQ